MSLPNSQPGSQGSSQSRLYLLPDPAGEPSGYGAIEDPGELRIAVRELRRVRAWIGQFADVVAESPGFGPEGARATKATAAMVTLLIERAEARLRRLTAVAAPLAEVATRPIVDSPDGSGVVAAG